MHYYNLTDSYLSRLNYEIESRWIWNKEPSVMRARCSNFALIPLSAIASITDTIFGVVASFASLATFGMHEKSVEFAFCHLDDSSNLLAGPYKYFVKTFNPEQDFDIGGIIDGQGFITYLVTQPCKQKAKAYAASRNLFTRNITARVTYALLALVSVITRVGEGIIGALALILTVFTPILSKENRDAIIILTYRGLQAPGVIHDLVYYTIKFINPWAGRFK